MSLTGYAPQGAIQFPAIGSLVSHELSDAKADLPGFVSIGGRRNGGTARAAASSGRGSPLVVGGGGGRRPATTGRRTT